MMLPDGTRVEKYVNRQEMPEAINIARRMYAQKQLEDLKCQKHFLENIIKYQTHESAGDRFLAAHPGINSLISSGMPPQNDWAAQWKKQPYPRNMQYPDKLIYSTVVPDLKVRSKSEADIVACFELYKVPYHYEELTDFNGTTLATDFTCLNVKSGNIWYWDHRGMMDDPSYINKTLYCDSVYLKAGVIPFINLIITTETKEHPLDIQWVKRLIEYYLI